MAALARRLKAATIGFGITVAPLFIIGMVQLTFLPQSVGAIEGLDSRGQAHVVSALRTDSLALHNIAAILVTIYWLLTAFIGGEEILRLRAANASLALFVVVLLILSLYTTFVRWPPVPEELKVLCSILGISDTDRPPFGFDTPSSCGAFIDAGHRLLLLGLLGLSILLLVTSLTIRIASSRRTRSANA